MRRGSLLLLFIPIALLVACGKQAAPADDVRPVRVMTVKLSDGAAVAELAGEVRPRVETRAGFQVPGRIVRRHVEVGQEARAGAPLAQIDPADFRLGLEAAQAQLTAAQVDRDQQRVDYKRFVELQAKGFISQADLDRRRAALDAAEARYTQAVASSKVSGNQAEYTTLRAPHDAVVAAVDAEVGQVVSAGQSVVRLARTGEKEVAIGVPETQLGLVQPGKEVQVRFWSGGQARGRVREIAPVADPATRTYPARVSLIDPPAGIALGMTATVALRSPVQQVLLIPLQAVLLEGATPQVWIYDQGSVRRQPVEVGGVAGNELVVKQGLKSGDQVVTAGVHLLKDGQKVRPIGDAPPAPPAAPSAPTAGARNG